MINWINPTSRIWPFRNKCGVSRWWLPFIETLCTPRAAAAQQLAQSTITPRRKTSSWRNFFDWKTFSRASLLTERLTKHLETKSETWKQYVWEEFTFILSLRVLPQDGNSQETHRGYYCWSLPRLWISTRPRFAAETSVPCLPDFSKLRKEMDFYLIQGSWGLVCSTVRQSSLFHCQTSCSSVLRRHQTSCTRRICLDRCQWLNHESRWLGLPAGRMSSGRRGKWSWMGGRERMERTRWRK